ncbi:hypothetical protein D8674_012773 [Pyrus ussuriensis x Pyrus communis]|uniref:Uncharacterized protein n=1 Tax=Pyrus ussuriensis x Pyrus communis TaxID=2448454 RepID=A0A5N5H1F9_9ROSA|nr:hypothetical protein D8674_012773 [Pyrus ussuriensis x Pyrus communis]
MAAKSAPPLFLEDWLRSVSGGGSSRNTSAAVSRNSSTSSARAIIQAWAELRDCLQHQSFQSRHLQSLKTLANSQTSLHVAEPQAKLLLSILSSPDLSLPPQSYPLFLRLLYIWVRKSARPNSGLIDSAVEVLSNLFSTQYVSNKSPALFSEGVLLLGAFSLAHSASESSKKDCLGLLCRLLAEDYQVLGSFGELIPDLLAGIGYALSSSVNVHFVTVLDFVLSVWGKESGPPGSVCHGLMILHLMEWVMSGLSSFRSVEKVDTFSREVLETDKANYVPFAVVMAAAGVLRALSRSIVSGLGMDTISRLRRSAEDRIESVARELVSRTIEFASSDNDLADNLLLQCVSIALARTGAVSARAPLLICLASALLTEIFPLRRLYMKVLKPMHDSSAVPRINEVREHLESLAFKEAGAITGVFCNLYVSVDEQSQHMVENLLWDYCQQIYMEHRQVALVLRGKEDEVLGDLEKIAESAFLMVVLFALTVTKHKLNSKFTQETQMDTSVRILISFSCLEYFRRIRLPEYMDTIRGIVVSVQESDSACVSFVRSMPTYGDLTNGPEFSFLRKMEYVWTKDEVQTARVLFYLRVIPTCIARLPSPVFGDVVAPTMFLYMGHPNGKVPRASHSMFSAFISSGKDSDQDERELLKEKLVFYYMQRSLQEYPKITPFEGMASGVAALVRHLPAGSPAIFYCIHCLVEKAKRLCIEDFAHQADMWKNWQGESEPGKKILDLLLRLISLVDIQVLPDLMKQLAQLIAQLPKDGQNMILNELYSQVAESDDVTRKPTLVSWLQSLSYLCFQETSGSAASRKVVTEAKITSKQTPDLSHETSLNARL